MIAPDTNVGRLLEEHPQLVDVLARVHPHFGHLRNRLLRKLMAPRVTLAQAARMAGVPTEQLLAAVRQAVGEAEAPPPAPPSAAAAPPDPALVDPPAALGALRPVEVDVRDDIRHGVEPFVRIMAAVKALGAGEALRLRAPFEPIPLYDVLARRGLAHWTARQDADDWSVWFYRAGTEATPEPSGRAATALPPPSATIQVDVRGLEPPQPMVTVLERLDRLAPDERLLVIHERRPLFLYPQLDDRGFTHETREVAPGHVEILIRRASPESGG